MSAVLDDLLFSKPELQALTGYVRPSQQVAELHRQGFWRARLSRIGDVILERSHYDAVTRGTTAPLRTRR